MTVKFTEQAEADIIDSYLYGLQTFGHAQADRYEQSLRHAIDLIDENPRLGAEHPEYKPPLRIHHHGRHYIIYSIETDHVLIIRILRDESDLTRYL